MPEWLLQRLFQTKDQARPRFALQGAVNWMRGLSIIVDSPLFSDKAIADYYLNVQRRHPVNLESDTLAMENVLLALHNISSLNSMNIAANKYDIVRSAIISWYYAIYYFCSAMTLAASGANSENHTGTARIWQADIVNRELAIGPFGLSVRDLTPDAVKTTISMLRNGNVFALPDCPKNEYEAWGAIYSYLDGTADYEKWRIEEELKKSKEFKQLNVADFRTKDARTLRDSRLLGAMVNFLAQAFRFRGKANYRDSIYLSYGDNRANAINQFIADLENVAMKFTRMVSFYISRRIERDAWGALINDLETNIRITVNFDILKV
ncbi:MAG: hypothetical protein WC695_08170 [Candidatus Omnitrophota bacterium]